MKFKGWDWSELFRIWPETKKIKWPEPTYDTPFSDEEAQVAWLRNKFWELNTKQFTDKGLSEKDKLQIKNIREFVKTIAKNSRHTCQPLLIGLSKIEDDESFLKYTDILLEGLWT